MAEALANQAEQLQEAAAFFKVADIEKEYAHLAQSRSQGSSTQITDIDRKNERHGSAGHAIIPAPGTVKKIDMNREAGDEWDQEFERY